MFECNEVGKTKQLKVVTHFMIFIVIVTLPHKFEFIVYMHNLLMQKSGSLKII